MKKPTKAVRIIAPNEKCLVKSKVSPNDQTKKPKKYKKQNTDNNSESNSEEDLYDSFEKELKEKVEKKTRKKKSKKNDEKYLTKFEEENPEEEMINNFAKDVNNIITKKKENGENEEDIDALEQLDLDKEVKEKLGMIEPIEQTQSVNTNSIFDEDLEMEDCTSSSNMYSINSSSANYDGSNMDV